MLVMSSLFFVRDSHSEWDGVQAAPSRNCGLWDGLNGWSAKPCFQRLHAGKTKIIHACLPKREEWQIKPSQSQHFERVKPTYVSIVRRNISVCDYCLLECFLTSDDTLCPPWHQRLVKQETGLAHKRSFSNGTTINLLKIARPQCKGKLFIFTYYTSGYVYRHMSQPWLKLRAVKQLVSQTKT